MDRNYVMRVGRRCFTSENQDVKNAENPSDMKNRNTAEIVKNNHFTTYKEKVCGFIRVQCLGLYISSNIIIEEFTVGFMHKNYTACTENGFRSRKLIS